MNSHSTGERPTARERHSVAGRAASRGGQRASTPLGLAIFLFLFFNLFYLVTSTGRVRTIDEVLPVFQAESLFLHGTTAVPQAVAANVFYGKYDRRGRPQAPYAPGFAVAILPWYALGHTVMARLPGVPRAAWNVASDFTVVSANASFAALAATLAFLIFLRLGIAPKSALAATALLAFATPLWAYSGWFYSEPLAAALLLTASLMLFAAPSERPPSAARLALAGALLGAVIWIRPAHVIAAPVFLLALLVREGKGGGRSALVVGTVIGLFAAAYLWRNAALFGHPFDFGYPATAEGGKRLNTFETPWLVGLYGFLLSPGKSVFLFAPPIFLAIYGLPQLWRRDRGLASVAALTPLVYLFFYAKYTQWEGGYCYGPRYLVPAVALLCLALGPAVAKAGPRLRVLLVVAFIAGFLVQGIGLATSFLEDQATGRYYDANWNYRLSYNPLVSQTHQLFHYLAMPGPALIGRGFDRWFVFLAKAGVSRALLATLLTLMLAGAAVSAWGLKQRLERTG